MASKHWWPTAQTPDHVKAFCQLMVDKRYRGIKVTPTRGVIAQPEHDPLAFKQMHTELSRYVAQCASEQSPILPFHVRSCVVEPAQGKFRSIFTDFDLEMAYNHNHGFNAVYIHLEQLSPNLDRGDSIIRVDGRIRHNAFIPTAVQAASLHLPEASHRKLSDLFDEDKIEGHIEDLRVSLSKKGYKGLYMGRLDEAPLSWVLREQFQNARALGTTDVSPFRLLTELSRPDHETKNAPLIQGEFKITYSPNNGFRIQEFVITSTDRNAPRHTRTVARNEDIPGKAEALILGHRRRNGLKH